LTINIKPKQTYRYHVEDCGDTPRCTWVSPHLPINFTDVRFKLACVLLITYQDKNLAIKVKVIINSLDHTPWHSFT